LRQDEAASEADVVRHGKDEEVARQIDEQGGVKEDVDDGVGEKDPIDGSGETFVATSTEEPEKATLKSDQD